MRKRVTHGHVSLWLSEKDTYNWAHKDGAAWPCSFLSGRRLYAEFAPNGDLVDTSIDNGKGDQDCPVDEFDAIVEDFLGTSHPRG